MLRHHRGRKISYIMGSQRKGKRVRSIICHISALHVHFVADFLPWQWRRRKRWLWGRKPGACTNWQRCVYVLYISTLLFISSLYSNSCLWTTLERRWNCALTPLATSQQHNQSPLSPARFRRLRLLLDANLDQHSSEEELERISCGDNRKWVPNLPQHCNDRHSSASSDEEVRDLCGYGAPAGSTMPLVEPGACLAASPSPVLFSSSPPRSLKPPPMCFKVQMVAQPIVLTHFEQTAPYRKYRHSFSGEPRRPSLDLEKMQQVCTLVHL